MGDCSEAGKGSSAEVAGNTRHCMRLVSSGVAKRGWCRIEILTPVFYKWKRMDSLD